MPQSEPSNPPIPPSPPSAVSLDGTISDALGALENLSAASSFRLAAMGLVVVGLGILDLARVLRLKTQATKDLAKDLEPD